VIETPLHDLAIQSGVIGNIQVQRAGWSIFGLLQAR